MGDRRVVRVTREEFELDDGVVFPIEPPLDWDPTSEEFQEHYDRSRLAIEGLGMVEGQVPETATSVLTGPTPMP
jgi:hypothetical protein